SAADDMAPALPDRTLPRSGSLEEPLLRQAREEAHDAIDEPGREERDDRDEERRGERNEIAHAWPPREGGVDDRCSRDRRIGRGSLEALADRGCVHEDGG